MVAKKITKKIVKPESKTIEIAKKVSEEENMKKKAPVNVEDECQTSQSDSPVLCTVGVRYTSSKTDHSGNTALCTVGVCMGVEVEKNSSVGSPALLTVGTHQSSNAGSPPLLALGVSKDGDAGSPAGCVSKDCNTGSPALFAVGVGKIGSVGSPALHTVGQNKLSSVNTAMMVAEEKNTATMVAKDKRNVEFDDFKTMEDNPEDTNEENQKEKMKSHDDGSRVQLYIRVDTH